MTRVCVVGAGLAGLFTAVLAGERGAEVTLLARGRGSLELSHGCVDIWGYGDVDAVWDELDSEHPFRLTGKPTLENAVEAFLRITRAHDLTYLGDLHAPVWLPTAVGALRPTNYFPRAQAAGVSDEEEPLTVGTIEAFRDFYPELVAHNLAHAGYPIAGTVTLPLPGLPERDFYATDLARRLDAIDDIAEWLPLWEHKLDKAGVRRLLLPAILGYRKAAEIHQRLEAVLGVHLAEVPTLPPSLPGLRLERALWQAADSAGVHLVEGPQVSGLTGERRAGGHVTGLSAQTAGGERIYPADVVILATGNVLNGGVFAPQRGALQEAVFGLPIVPQLQRADWAGKQLQAGQPFERAGVAVDTGLRPVATDGRTLYDNVHVVGGLLAGADRIGESSRQGIDLASAYHAVEVALA